MRFIERNEFLIERRGHFACSGHRHRKWEVDINTRWNLDHGTTRWVSGLALTLRLPHQVTTTASSMVVVDRVVEAVLTTLMTSGGSTAIATLVGIPIALACSEARRDLTGLRTVVRSLYALPPVVVGVFVYLMLSEQGPAGGLNLLFTVRAMILAQVILILPLIWGVAWDAFDAHSGGVRDAIILIGATGWNRRLLRIRAARRGCMAAVMIGGGRALAEVGAVLMVGGNIAGRTRVLTTSIVLETSRGEMDQALLLGAILLIIALAFAIPLTRRGRIEGSVGLAPVDVDSIHLEPVEGGVIRVTDCSMMVNGSRVLKDVSLEVQRGVSTVILGASGAGKSTLLRVIAGLAESEGGIDVQAERVAMVPQHPIIPFPTAREAIEIATSLGPRDDGVIIADSLGLEPALDRPSQALSGGERQRVALASALIRAPDVLMLDEATTGLDGPAVEAVESLIVRLVDHGVTVLMATHNVLQARRLAERVIVLDEGRVLASGSWGEVEGALRGRPEARLLDGRWIG